MLLYLTPEGGGGGTGARSISLYVKEIHLGVVLLEGVPRSHRKYPVVAITTATSLEIDTVTEVTRLIIVKSVGCGDLIARAVTLISSQFTLLCRRKIL